MNGYKGGHRAMLRELARMLREQDGMLGQVRAIR